MKNMRKIKGYPLRMPELDWWLRVVPVSYTHLDVYKRQQEEYARWTEGVSDVMGYLGIDYSFYR